MEYIMIDESTNLELGFDRIGKEYFIRDKANNNWFWFSKLSEAVIKFSQLSK